MPKLPDLSIPEPTIEELLAPMAEDDDWGLDDGEISSPKNLLQRILR